MATLLSIANGNFTDAATWGVCDATSELDSFAASTALSSSQNNSQAFTPGAITISGIAIKIVSRSSTAGTITVVLRNNTAAANVAGTTVTINVNDLITTGVVAFGTLFNAWYYFKFASPVTLLAATSYSVGASATSSNVTLYRSATANDWCRQLVTTTTAAPAAADKLLICGAKTAAGASTAITVTMNNTASTNFGLISICHGGTLDFATTAATNYVLNIAGSTITSLIYGFEVQNGGTLQIGTSGTRIPADSTIDITLVNSTNVANGFRTALYSTFTAYGADKTSWSLLDTNYNNVLAGQTYANVVSATGWIANDTVAFGSTTRTVAECETRTISGSPAGNYFNLSSGVTYTHHKDKTTSGEVANLTRNIKIHGTSASLQSYVYISIETNLNLNSVEFYWLGSNTSIKRGIDDLHTSSGVNSAVYTNCVFRNFEVVGSVGINIPNEGVGKITLNSCVFYYIESSAIINGRNTAAIAVNCTTINNCLCMRQVATGNFYYINITGWNCSANINGLIICGAQNAFSLGVGGLVGNWHYPTPWYNLTIHACPGVQLTTGTGGNAGQPAGVAENERHIITNLTFWGCTNPITYMNSNYTLVDGMTVADCGTTVAFICTSYGNAIIRNFVFDGLNAITFGIGTLSAGTSTDLAASKIKFENGIIRNYTSAAIQATFSVFSALVGFECLEFNNVLFQNVNSTIVSTPANIHFPNSIIISNHHNQIPNNYYVAKKYLEITKDEVLYYNNTSSIKIKPYHATIRGKSEPFYVAGRAGDVVTVSVWVRHSLVGDGAAYNGATKARLMQMYDYGLFGSFTDATLATAVAANGVWEKITGTITFTYSGVAKVYVDCLGTAGWVNVDGFSTNKNYDINAMEYAVNGFPLATNNIDHYMIKRRKPVRVNSYTKISKKKHTHVSQVTNIENTIIHRRRRVR